MTRRTMLAMTAAAFAAERKNRAPISHEMVTMKLPEATPVALPNGLTLLVMEDNRFPLAWIDFQVDGAGRVYTPKPGVAQITAQMLGQGTKTRSARLIAESAARAGATLRTGVFSNRETATIDGSGLSEHFDDWMAICADVLMNPAFSPDEFNSQVERWRVEIHLRMAQPAAIAQGAILRLIYGSHPGGDYDPPLEALTALTPQMAEDWHRERYAPASTVLTVIGRVRASQVEARVKELLGNWNTPAAKFSLPPEPQPAPRRQIRLIDRPGAPQTRIEMGNLLFPSSHPDYFTMQVLGRLLGGGGDSRLYRMLESSGQALEASSNNSTAHYTGCWTISAAVRTESTGNALTTILGELRRLCDEPVPLNELDRTKGAETGHFALTLERPTDVINYSYQRLRYGFSSDYWEHYPSRIQAVTAAEVQRVAQKYYDPSRAHIAVVGDAAKIRRELEKLGPVEA